MIYVATPYTKYAGGLEGAYIAACQATAALMKQGLSVYSPIAHSHGVAMHGRIDPRDHKIWLPANDAMMALCTELYVIELQGWDDSLGVRYEIDAFFEAGKPVKYIDPKDIGL